MEDIVKDLLKKIDDQNKIIAKQNVFISNAISYYIEKEAINNEIERERFNSLMTVLNSNRFLDKLLDAIFPKRQNPFDIEEENEDDGGVH